MQAVQLSSANGQPIEGEYFQSAFDMAVVVHPAAPEALAEGTPITLEYAVADRMERSAKGREAFPLRRIEHP